jgi:hypothetical protein
VEIRSLWDEAQEEWFFSVVDVVAVLTESTNPTDYLKKLRKRDELLGNYLGTNCPQVAMKTSTGKSRKTLAATTEQLLRINPQSMDEHKNVAKRCGGVAKEARLKLEAETGKKVVSKQNAKRLQLSKRGGKKDD